MNDSIEDEWQAPFFGRDESVLLQGDGGRYRILAVRAGTAAPFGFLDGIWSAALP